MVKTYTAKKGTKEIPYYSSPQTTFLPAGVIKVDPMENFTSYFSVTRNGSNLVNLAGYGWVAESYLTFIKEEKDKVKEEIKDIASAIDENYIDTLNKRLPGLDGASARALVDRIESGLGTLDVSTRLFGQPFQFNESTDFRINEEGFGALGRKYVETFIAEAPIVHILPGASSFLPGIPEEERKKATEFFKSSSNGSMSEDATKHLEAIMAGESRYFEFVSTYVNYMRYVNLMCRASAIYMGLGGTEVLMDKAILQREYQYFDWKNYKYSGLSIREEEGKKSTIFDNVKDVLGELRDENIIKEAAKSILGMRNGVQFYVDPGSSFQETSSNNTMASSLSSIFETAQGYAKEAHFYSSMLDGDGGGNGAFNAAVGLGTDALNFGSNLASGGVFGKLFGAGKSIINAGNVILPEIWGDSNYQKSYSININLISPYGTKESVYLHVLVPLFHALALAAPRQITANGFGHPFLVKVSCKGWFNCEMGMIDSISIEKVQGSYTVNGVPTEVKLSLSVRDLYSELMVTSATAPDLFIANRGLTNWLAVTSGIDITSPAMVEKWESILKMLLIGSVEGFTDTFDSFKETMQNIMSSFVYI